MINERIERFLDTLESLHTRRAYRRDLLKFATFMGEREKTDGDGIISAETADVVSFMKACNRRGESSSTRRRRLAALRSFFEWAVEMGETRRNPARRVSVDTTSNHHEQDKSGPLTLDDVQQLVESLDPQTAKQVRNRAIILTIVNALVRRREIAALKVKHIRPLGGRVDH